MAYQFIEFDGVPLPLYDHRQGHDPMPIESTLLDSIGGAFDWTGTSRRKGRKQALSLTGVYLGELDYLVDDAGDFLVDSVGDTIIGGSIEIALRAAVGALAEKAGVRGTLWRKRLSDGVRQWKTARLLQLGWPRTNEDQAVKATLTARFESSMEYWHAATATTSAVNVSAGVPTGLVVDNGGPVTVDDATITIARTGGSTITAVSVFGIGLDFGWTGSLAGTESLTIDCGALTVRNGTTDSYSGFSLGAGHTVAGWLPLVPGPNALTITVTGGTASVTVSHYNQFP